MNKRQIQKEATRKQILRIAMELFARKGLAATTTSDIALESKVSHGTIFLHYPTKESLINEAIEEFGRLITSRMHELVDESCSMKELLSLHLKVIEDHEDFYIRLVREAPIMPESARNTLIGFGSTISFHFSQVALREMEEKRIRIMPMHLMFNTWLGLVHYYLMNRELFVSSGTVLKQYGRELTDHFLLLISKSEGEEE